VFGVFEHSRNGVDRSKPTGGGSVRLLGNQHGC
jgi:hypothetical protein